jgi:hypothetical protein
MNQKIIDIFKLPIEYITDVSLLDNNTLDDLELIKSKDISGTSVYEKIFSFSNNSDISNNSNTNISIDIAKKSAKFYTNNKKYIQESSRIIKYFNLSNKNKLENDVSHNYNNTYTLFNDILNDKNFINKYYYIENSWFKHLNYNSQILQALSIYSITSPLLSILLPIIFMIIPFFILKIGGIPISLNAYISILKNVFSSHVIGNVLMNFSEANIEKKIYLCVTISLYLFQIYQNLITCINFYKNLTSINNTLITMREYIEYTINNINNFELLCENRKINTYKDFRKELDERKSQLISYKNELINIQKWSIKPNTILNIGHSMKLFYMLNSNDKIKNDLLYSFGFNGYIDNLRTLHIKYKKGELSFCKFSKNKTKFIDAYYYPLLSLNVIPIKNSYSLDKQLIITGPNAAGKTTLIKTTFLNILFSQQFGLGFYKKAKISLFDKLHCYLNIPDTQGRDSLFQAEARRCKNILETISSNQKNEKHFCIFDELYSGTNPYEAISAGSSFLKYLNNYNVSYILTTHYIELCNIMERNTSQSKYNKKILNCHMETEKNNDINLTNDFIYKYKLKNGISSIKGGVKVLIDLKYPNEIIDETKELIKNVNL